MGKMRKGMMSMSVNIRKHLVSNNIANRVTYSGKNSKKYIVIHETANTRKGANANAHARLQASGNSRQASWHYTVDDKEIVQSFDDNKQCWHAGNKYYNQNSIGIEICVNSDGNFKKAVDNAVKLTKHLMDKYKISVDNVIQHNQASGKNCPRYLRSGAKGVTWSQFKAKLSDKTSSKPKPSKPSKSTPKPSKTTSKLTVDGKWGKDTTRALQKALGTPVDGIISNQLRNSVTTALYGNTVRFGRGGSPMILALQRKIGAKVDGYLGPETVRKLQRYLGTVVDGKLSRPSLAVKELQRRLNAGTF